MTSLDIATAAVRALDSKLGQEIALLKVRDLTVITDYFVICTGGTNTQVRALADEVEYRLEQAGVRPARTQGARVPAGSCWITIPCSFMFFSRAPAPFTASISCGPTPRPLILPKS